MAVEAQHIAMPSDATIEGVALSLMQLIARAEGRRFDKDRTGGELVDRKWILDTYAECLLAVKSPSNRG